MPKKLKLEISSNSAKRYYEVQNFKYADGIIKDIPRSVFVFVHRCLQVVRGHGLVSAETSEQNPNGLKIR